MPPPETSFAETWILKFSRSYTDRCSPLGERTDAVGRHESRFPGIPSKRLLPIPAQIIRSPPFNSPASFPIVLSDKVLPNTPRSARNSPLRRPPILPSHPAPILTPRIEARIVSKTTRIVQSAAPPPHWGTCPPTGQVTGALVGRRQVAYLRAVTGALHDARATSRRPLDPAPGLRRRESSRFRAAMSFPSSPAFNHTFCHERLGLALDETCSRECHRRGSRTRPPERSRAERGRSHD